MPKFAFSNPYSAERRAFLKELVPGLERREAQAQLHALSRTLARDPAIDAGG